MARLLVIGDPHFKKNNIPLMCNMGKKIASIIDTNELSGVVVLGDVLDKHENVNSNVLSTAVEFLSMIKSKTKLYLIIGNHDRINNSDFMSNIHPFTALKSWENTVVVDTTKKVIIGGATFIFVPYVFPGRFHEAVTACGDFRDATAIFAHQEFYGCKMGAIKSRDGDSWEKDNPLVITGHIHDYQKLQNNIIYVGTPVQHSFGDRGRKTVSIFSFDNGTYKEKRIDLGLRRKRTLYMDIGEISAYKGKSKDDVRIVFRGTKAEVDALIQSGEVERLKEMGVKLACKVNINKKKVKNGISFVDRISMSVAGNEREEKWLGEILSSY